MTARFAVRMSEPMYHHSTDGYLGMRTVTIDIFPTLEEAWESAYFAGADASVTMDPADFDEVRYFVAYRGTNEWGHKVWLTDWHNFSPYARATSFSCPGEGKHSVLCEEQDKQFCSNYYPF